MGEKNDNSEQIKSNPKKGNSRRTFLKVAALAAGGTALVATVNGVTRLPLLKDGGSNANSELFVAGAKPVMLAKYVDPLVVPPIISPKLVGGLEPYPGTDYYEISIQQGNHKFHSSLPPATTQSYWGGILPNAGNFFYLGPTIIAQQGKPVKIKVTNNLPLGSHLIGPAMDYTISGNTDPSKAGLTPWADEHRTCVHLHGSRTYVYADGGPRDWFSPAGSTQVNPYPEAVDPLHTGSHTYDYPNTQPASFIWYHDHAWGITRFNPFLGQAAGYIIRDLAENALIASGALPSGAYEVPIVLQDRLLDLVTGSWIYPVTATPGFHPQWIPEYFGNIPIINGTAYPFLNVEPRRYRFKFLNGTNARFFNMFMQGPQAGNMPIWVIASDQGFLPAPAMNTSLLIAPGERFDAIIDFTGLKPGTTLTLKNNAKAPYPGGRGGEIPELMQFKVVALTAPDISTPPATLVLPAIDGPLTAPAATSWREIVLSEIMDPVTGGPLEALLDGQPFAATFAPNPPLFTETDGQTNVWQFVNTTGDAHPMHTHLFKFKIVDRQAFDSKAFLAAWNIYVAARALNPQNPAVARPSVTAFLKGAAVLPAPEETGWKDTAKSYPGEVLRVIAKFDLPTNLPNGSPLPSGLYRYVCHCHILEHEENDMMFYFGVNKP
jgi:spore coat protein A, manganese oxidase